MIDPQARVTHPGISEVIPESIDALVWMQLPYGVGPAQSDEACEGFPYFRPKKRIIKPAFRLVDIQISRDNVVVAGENGGRFRGEQIFCMFRQALYPTEFVIELGAGCWIAVGKIKAGDEHTVD